MGNYNFDLIISNNVFKANQEKWQKINAKRVQETNRKKVKLILGTVLFTLAVVLIPGLIEMLF